MEGRVLEQLERGALPGSGREGGREGGREEMLKTDAFSSLSQARVALSLPPIL